MSYNEWLDIDVLEDYLDGKLDAKTMHKVERISLEDPFVAEALAGLSQSPKRSQSLSLLQKQLQERVAQKPIEKKRWTLTSHRLSIAAAAAVLFISVSVLFWMKENNRRQFEAQQAKKVDVDIAAQVAETKTVKPTPPVPPSPKVELEIDKALANSKANSIAKINEKEPLVQEPEPTVITAPAKPVVSAARVPVATQSAVVNEEIKINEALAKKKEVKALNEVLVSKAAGIKFNPNINGKVVSKYDGMPIQGADVILAGGDVSTITNNKGEFHLRADTTQNQQLAIGYPGFASQVVKVNGNQSFKVELEANKNAQNENVVVGYGTYKNTSPIPFEGWSSFSKYLAENNKLLKNGTTATGKLVKLTFKVQKNGRPSSIKILQGLTKAENDEAIRLIQDGPKWTLPSTSTNTVELSIKF
ncbi:carboxypeptidase-like regulatory domain-containing protein [Pedobacter frigiditerrae]|uniref:carboxypeptidase-like regulatory domain-containing protein n=1 Tax=Pedobacter frigiditerrae TaxID=2530452 RepID=UPI00292EE8A3|nr:carboxypeptidase-like regulatory domain-containing protein [Pedobacter frigiditerrae]